jgi:hypothetical protein
MREWIKKQKEIYRLKWIRRMILRWVCRSARTFIIDTKTKEIFSVNSSVNDYLDIVHKINVTLYELQNS